MFLEQSLAPGPARRDAATGKQQGHAALPVPVRQGRAQKGIQRRSLLSARSGQLAAGKKQPGRACALGQRHIRQGQGAFRTGGVFHVLQGEFVGRGRHEIAPHHILARRQAELGHGEIFRAQFFALPAERAAVDQSIGRVQTLDDGGVIVDLAGVNARVAFVFLQIDAFPHADQALALQAAPGLQGSFFRGIDRAGGLHPRQGGDAVQGRVQGALHLFARSRQRYLAHQPFQGLSGTAALPGLRRSRGMDVSRGRPAEPAGATDIVAPVQGPRVHAIHAFHGVHAAGRILRRGQIRGRARVYEHAVELRRCPGQKIHVQRGGVEHYLLAAQQFPVVGQGIIRAVRAQGRILFQQNALCVPLIKNRHRIALARKIPGRRQARQARAQHGQAEFFARHGQGAALGAHGTRAGMLQGVDGQAAAQVQPQADVFTRMIANPGKNARQRQMALQNFPGFRRAAFGHPGHEGPHIQIEGADRLTMRRALLGTAGLDFVQTGLIHFPGLSMWTLEIPRAGDSPARGGTCLQV